jgi:hypothetical protein
MEVEATMNTATLGLAEPTPWSESQKSHPVSSPTASTASATASNETSFSKETPHSECSEGFDFPSPEEVRYVKPEAWEVAVRARFSDLIGLEPDERVSRELINRMVRMLRLCNYPLDSINSVLAASLALFEKVCNALPAGGKNMVPVERTAIAILSCYLEHTYILDETCPLHYWQARIYVDYCSVKELNLAVVKILRLIKYRLSVTPEAVASYLEKLSPPDCAPQDCA